MPISSRISTPVLHTASPQYLSRGNFFFSSSSVLWPALPEMSTDSSSVETRKLEKDQKQCKYGNYEKCPTTLEQLVRQHTVGTERPQEKTRTTKEELGGCHQKRPQEYGLDLGRSRGAGK